MRTMTRKGRRHIGYRRGRKSLQFPELGRIYPGILDCASDDFPQLRSSGDAAGCISCTAGDTRETSYLYQRFSITIQRFNAVAFHDSFKQTDLDES